MNASAPFNHEDPRYKCCCHNCHVKTGTTILAVVHAIFTAMEVLKQFRVGNFGAAFLNLMISGLVLYFAFKALNTENHKYLIPFLVWHIIIIIFLTIAAIGCVLFAVFGSGDVLEHLTGTTDGEEVENENQREKIMTAVLMSAAAVLLFVVLLYTWFVTIIFGCYRYFSDKQLYGVPPMHSSHPVVLQQSVPGYAYPHSVYNAAPMMADLPPSYDDTVKEMAKPIPE